MRIGDERDGEHAGARMQAAEKQHVVRDDRQAVRCRADLQIAGEADVRYRQRAKP